MGWIEDDLLAWFAHLANIAFGLVFKHIEDSVGVTDGKVDKLNVRDFLCQSNNINTELLSTHLKSLLKLRKQCKSFLLKGLQTYDQEKDALNDKEGLVKAEAEERSRQASADTTAVKTPPLGVCASSAIPVTLMANFGQYKETVAKADVAFTQCLSSKALLMVCWFEYFPPGTKIVTLCPLLVSTKHGREMGLAWGRRGLLKKIEFQKDLIRLEIEQHLILVAEAIDRSNFLKKELKYLDDELAKRAQQVAKFRQLKKENNTLKQKVLLQKQMVSAP